MATKAERARSEMERSGPKRAPKPARRTKPRPGPHNEAARVAGKAGFELEDRPEATTPSRKSTRKSGNRQKAASNLKLRQMNRLAAPAARQP